MSDEEQLPKIIAVVGPTGAGKSDVAVSLARSVNGELISADSRQLYRGMDIGTAKLFPPADVKQWLVDVAEPDQRYTLANFQHDAFTAIDDILDRGKMPVLVGGTALYVYAVLENWQIPADAQHDDSTTLTKKELADKVEKLKSLDPQTAAVIDCSNPRRVTRALAYVEETGQSYIAAQQKGEPRYEALKIGIAVPPERLRKRIEKRARVMLQEGAVEETKQLCAKYSDALPAMSAIEYRIIARHLDGNLDADETASLMATKSYQYSRRQMTWWKRDKNVRWVTNEAEALRLVSDWL